MTYAYCECEKKQNKKENIMGKITVSSRFLQALSPFIRKKPCKHDWQNIMNGIFETSK